MVDRRSAEVALLLSIAVFLVLSSIAALGFGRWALDRAALSRRLERGRARTLLPPYDRDETRGLPPPVVRYFAAALTPGSAFIERATLVQEGTMRMSAAREVRFRATSRVVVRRPGFAWEARFEGPLGLRVIDAYADGQGSLDVAVLAGALRLQRLRDRPGLAESQLQRWLAEAPWYPAALLPRAGVHWEAVDDRSAMATIPDGLNAASLLFRFGEDGLVESVFATARAREVGGRLVPSAWEGRFANPVERAGYRVPREGTVTWVGDPAPYWSGTILDARYD